MNDHETSDQVEVVIVNWERPEDTIQCIRSVLQSKYPNFQILVVDNGSSDDSIEKISQACDQITLIALPENIGFAGGYNAGIEKALESGAPFIFLLNNDTVINENTLS
ncbi:MAG: glycosyltransferase, partial [Anaerolineales bacterium]